MRSGVFNNITSKVLILLITVLLLTTIGSQIYRYLNDRHDTQDAVLYTVNEDISFQGIIVRDETQMTYSGSDVVSYRYADGSKVSKGDAVAKIYDSQEAASVDEKTKNIENEIQLLQRAQNPGTTDYVQPESISRKIDEHYKQLITYVNEGSFEEFASEKSDMSLVMNIYSIISGLSTDYNARIAELQSEMNLLKTSYNEAKEEITAPMTGYFVSYCDGYEDKLNRTNILDKKQSDLEKIIEDADSVRESVSDNALGKIFEDYSCIIAGVIDEDSRVSEDAVLRLKIDSSDNVYKVRVKAVKPAEEKGKSIVFLQCDSLDEALVSQRVQAMQLIFDEFSGIKVPKKAIRFQGDQKGVYVILGQNITFKKIDVIYDGDDFSISRNTSDEEYLLLYDQILMEVVTEQDVQRSNDSAAVSGGS